MAIVYPIHVMPREVSPHFTVYHIYIVEDPKNVGGALCWDQPIVHQEISSDLSYRDFHPAFYEGDHQNNYWPRKSIYN